ncbi:inner membrane protein YbaN [Methanobrevibacter cuticularis]|uniref:Inner membrane protein YbaN n=1 Tax=Methanobrevibacter cuticularis TaxID=47311 RepID=A0A166EBS2_9EURY|nr:YbaN family protein [Methanobrevibacter cuticularis]KZX16483.1 inner membrane protein YbaN [Methanobrevibacter cuticularis]
MKPKRTLFFSLGVVLVGVGAVGVALPVLPTTPFILAAAFCFSKSSKKAERWISNNRYFGSYIENYKGKKGVPMNVKRNTLIFLWVMLIASAIIVSSLLITVILAIVGICVTAHILLLKTKKDN